MNERKGTFLLISAAAMGGVGFIAMKNLLDSGYTSTQCILLRYAIAMVAMCLFYIK